MSFSRAMTLARPVSAAAVLGRAIRGFASGRMPQGAILNRDMGENQWYLHLSRVPGANLDHIKTCIQGVRHDCANLHINLVTAFGPTLLKDLTPHDMPRDFHPYTTFRSVDGSGKEAKGTQEEMLLWFNSSKKDDVWKTQFALREALKGHMRVARETMTFILGDSLDMTGFTDGTGNPHESRDIEVGIVPDGEPGAGGSHIIAQRWIHDLQSWNKLPVAMQEKIFGRTKDTSKLLPELADYSHLAHHDLRLGGAPGDQSLPKRHEITRRSTPYAFPAPPTGGDGIVGLYFIGFCKDQAPLVERMRAMYGCDGQVRDRLTDFSTPASGSFYFAPAVDVLDAL
eukprot:NODE_12582_length_1215_cov_11.340074.p1 GENE.NODE_12582_length_1215_cov_11.340074~~NODE_12582_length_1215_cov_11.340074.p1  ORF type:complete len:341 (-),score=102.83 NODE_12582_length_1215_cov_11.340074:101-1123(-)